jgi:radical SAM superfamily enzyme YgiQ (UPF0313 family)
MSNLGFQAIYNLLNGLEGVRCERTFLWETGGSGTLELGRPLRQFPLVGFSMSFELDTLNLLEILHRAHIPLLASQREEGDPLIMVGGPCAFLNPEPLAPFVDIFIVGEGEGILPPLMKVIETAGSREEILETSAQLEGIYIPRFFQVDYLPDGRIQAIRHLPPAPKRVKRQWVHRLSAFATFSSVITSQSHFKNMCLIEVQRGCGYGCRFCAMGSIYHPLRHRSLDSLRSQVGEAHKRGARIGLVGSAVADLPGLWQLCRQLTPSDEGMGISSLRADRLTSALIGKLAELGMRTITIAPEVGSERMRRVINKKVTEEDILRTATLAVEAGISQLKLYFIVGLPGEKEEDIRAILALVRRVSRVPGLRKIAVSASTFVPKAATPFQWVPMEKELILRRKMRILAQGLRPLRGVIFTAESPRRSLWQGALAMGDRRVGMVVWHHQVEELTWAKAWRKVGLRRDFYVHRERSYEEILPWDIIDHGVIKAQLWGEYLRAKEKTG